jgi:hypothetical protein
MIGIFKTEFYLIISFIVFLVMVIISGRILNEINKSSCTDPNIKTAHKWTAWAVGISSAAAGISLIAFIAILFVV